MMNDIEKHFQVPILNQVIARYLRIELGLYESDRKSHPVLDCLIYSETPVFQVSDSFYHISCELTQEAKNSLRSQSELLGVKHLKGMLVAISDYSFALKNKWSCVMHVKEIRLNKLHEVVFSRVSSPYYVDKTVSDYADLYQQRIEKKMLAKFRNSMVNAYDIVAGPSDNCPLIIKLTEGGNQLMDLTEDEINMLVDSLEPEDADKNKMRKKRRYPEADNTRAFTSKKNKELL
eukprot:TRINITY_DN13665_c0_g1_i3.p1 TRINITY_DN13665_c0_g1~~TRINITY_DN13665_c0_g1_i3.p1  ORF type:complete len:233 (-),score=41.86 TRINITY_DN13665_c0_g1_i3:95-793(-)